VILKNPFLGVFVTLVLASVSGAQTNPQSKLRPIAAKDKTSFYAVLDEGKRIEPIGVATNGKFPDSEGPTDSPQIIVSKAILSLIFGGSSIGSATINKKFTGECSGESGEVSIRPATSKLKGFVMALATNAKPDANTMSFRRIPTALEWASVEKLVRKIFTKEKVPIAATKVLRSQNLTAIDVDRDGMPELVGSFFVTPKQDERATLFFIAEKNGSGAYEFTHSEFEKYTAETVMSGEVKDLDDGIYHTLLLDYFDVDGDGVGEIFTTTQAFEGRNFDVYKRSDGKWKTVYEAYNYRCGY